MSGGENRGKKKLKKEANDIKRVQKVHIYRGSMGKIYGEWE